MGSEQCPGAMHLRHGMTAAHSSSEEGEDIRAALRGEVREQVAAARADLWKDIVEEVRKQVCEVVQKLVEASEHTTEPGSRARAPEGSPREAQERPLPPKEVAPVEAAARAEEGSPREPKTRAPPAPTSPTEGHAAPGAKLRAEPRARAPRGSPRAPAEAARQAPPPEASRRSVRDSERRQRSSEESGSDSDSTEAASATTPPRKRGQAPAKPSRRVRDKRPRCQEAPRRRDPRRSPTAEESPEASNSEEMPSSDEASASEGEKEPSPEGCACGGVGPGGRSPRLTLKPAPKERATSPPGSPERTTKAAARRRTGQPRPSKAKRDKAKEAKQAEAPPPPWKTAAPATRKRDAGWMEEPLSPATAEPQKAKWADCLEVTGSGGGEPGPTKTEVQATSSATGGSSQFSGVLPEGGSPSGETKKGRRQRKYKKLDFDEAGDENCGHQAGDEFEAELRALLKPRLGTPLSEDLHEQLETMIACVKKVLANHPAKALDIKTYFLDQAVTSLAGGALSSYEPGLGSEDVAS
ncbi:unnamed protein product [Prorocentrum cordatum]|uniref:Uncharacterized protein n=1 Tax=Prorocentrum cordatum TaxID=2364126 RepID=A0ABN9T8I0_9DINO|nr:unnamed protein product [Polarella glacialis]